MSSVTFKRNRFPRALQIFVSIWVTTIANIVFLTLFSLNAFAQNALYSFKAKEGKMYLAEGKYAEAAKSYSEAFQSNGWIGYMPDRLNAARAWAMEGTLDSAFSNLFIIADQRVDNLEQEGGYKYFLGLLNTDSFLEPLRTDARWMELINRTKANLPTMPDLAKQLEEVFNQDQNRRLKTDSVRTKFGSNSVELSNHYSLIRTQDSINQDIVLGVLEKQGWLGIKEVGWKGNSAIFLVVQHAPLHVQEKYLPMMRDAVKVGNAKINSLALLEDRVLTTKGEKQIYGSQLRRDSVTNEFYFCAIQDVDNVDQRRAMVGLGPISEYAKHFGLVWDAEAIEKNKKLLPSPSPQVKK